MGREYDVTLKDAFEHILDKHYTDTPKKFAWQKRPISVYAQHYAAMDAHCLIEMAKRLKEAANTKKDALWKGRKVLQSQSWESAI